jgi:putative addiction module component (TIGR02574 family)
LILGEHLVGAPVTFNVGALQSANSTRPRIIDLSISAEVFMSSAQAELKRKAAQLNDNERAELALALIESLDRETDVGVEEAWQIEVERRVAQIERGEVKLIPGDEVFARVRRKLG